MVDKNESWFSARVRFTRKKVFKLNGQLGYFIKAKFKIQFKSKSNDKNNKCIELQWVDKIKYIKSAKKTLWTDQGNKRQANAEQAIKWGRFEYTHTHTPKVKLYFACHILPTLLAKGLKKARKSKILIKECWLFVVHLN